MINTIVNEIIANTINNCISESLLFQIVDNNNVDDITFSIICENLTSLGISIINDSDFKNVKNESEIKHSKYYYDIIKTFEKLSYDEQKECIIELLSRQNNITEKYTLEISNKDKNQFIANISARPLQYSYVAVCLKAFLNCANVDGVARLSEMAKYADDFYISRNINGDVVEQQDSIIYKGYTLDELKRLLKYNPLSRSYLKYYLFKKRENKIEFVFMKPELWISLSNEDKLKIEQMLDKLLDDYYTKIS